MPLYSHLNNSIYKTIPKNHSHGIRSFGRLSCRNWMVLTSGLRYSTWISIQTSRYIHINPENFLQDIPCLATKLLPSIFPNPQEPQHDFPRLSFTLNNHLISDNKKTSMSSPEGADPSAEPEERAVDCNCWATLSASFESASAH